MVSKRTGTTTGGPPSDRQPDQNQDTKFQQYYTSRSEMDERRVARKILGVWDGIKKGVFIPNDGNGSEGVRVQILLDEFLEGEEAA